MFFAVSLGEGGGGLEEGVFMGYKLAIFLMSRMWMLEKCFWVSHSRARYILGLTYMLE